MRRFFEWIRIPMPRHTMPPPGRIEAATAAPIDRRRVGGVVSIQERIDILEMQLQQAESVAHWHKRQAQKLQERLNRIAKLTPGRQRIDNLHRLASVREYEADQIDQELADDLLLADTKREDDMLGSDERATQYGHAIQLRADVLFHRRLAHDLSELRDEVRGDKRMPGACNDPTLWRGPRP